MSNNTEKDYIEIYCFFKKSQLRWRLFKWQSLYMGLDKKCYKKLSGTRWGEHRITALESHLHNLPVLIGFYDQQIKQPHNQTMKKRVPVLEGIHKNIASTKSLLFNSKKFDILNLLQPMSKILQDTWLPSPTFITTCKVTMQNVKCMENFAEVKQRESFHDSKLFHHTRLVLNQLTEEVQEIVPQRQTCPDTAENLDHNYSLFHYYLLSCGVDESLDAVINEALEVIDKLITFFKNRSSCFIKDDFFTAAAAFLDTKSYVNEDCEELYKKSVPIIVSHYSQQLIANNCDVDHLKAEFRVMFAHVRKFLSGNSPSRCWPQLFQLKSSLGLKNILHIAEFAL